MITIKPGRLKGRLNVPPSKSLTHRAVIAAALAPGCSRIENIQLSKDIEATIECIKALGAVCTYDNSSLIIDGFLSLKAGSDIMLNCNESGSTLRFMIPVSLLNGGRKGFTGSQRLLERPLGPYEKFFSATRRDGNIFFSSSLEPGLYKLDGGISSQFVTGLLMALPLVDGDSRILMTSELQSKPYVDLTISVLADFGIEIENCKYESFNVKGRQNYVPREFFVEGDYSQAAFWLVANDLGSEIICDGLNPESLQGDKAITAIIKSNQRIISAQEIPDLVPILAVWLCFQPGGGKIADAGRLRIKESDRLHAISQELNKLGADITELEDSLIIKGVDTLCGGETQSHNDHRIAMALAIAATRCKKQVIIHGEECVSKSYPNFFNQYCEMII